MKPLDPQELPRLNPLQQRPVLKYADPKLPGEREPLAEYPQQPELPRLESALPAEVKPLYRHPPVVRQLQKLNPLPLLKKLRRRDWRNEDPSLSQMTTGIRG